MRVKDLHDILTALRMPKTGRKDDLVKRLKDMCRSSILVHAAGGRQHVERTITATYGRIVGAMGGGSGLSVVKRNALSGAKRKSDDMASSQMEVAAMAAAGVLIGGFGGRVVTPQGYMDHAGCQQLNRALTTAK
jgi:hypothetical protein